MTKEEFLTKTQEILAHHNFTSEAKEYLLEYFEYLFENLTLPQFLSENRDIYLNKYLKTLEKINSFKIYTASDINNFDDHAATQFRKSMVEVEEQNGSYLLTNNGFVSSPNNTGNYECNTLGFALRSTCEINVLELQDKATRTCTYHHELTHQTEGEYPFLIPTNLPLATEIRKSLIEGRASFNESLISIPKNYIVTEALTENNQIFNIVTNSSYCFYKWIYFLLVSLYDYETIEELSQNTSLNFNSLDYLRTKFPNVDTNTIFAHLTYILSCYHNISKKEFKYAIQTYANHLSFSYDGNEINIENTTDHLTRVEKYISHLKKELASLEAKLINPEILTREYNTAISMLQTTISSYIDINMFRRKQNRTLMLLINREIKTRTNVRKVVRIYFSKWRIEEYFRANKQEYVFEKYMVRTLESI